MQDIRSPRGVMVRPLFSLLGWVPLQKAVNLNGAYPFGDEVEGSERNKKSLGSQHSGWALLPISAGAVLYSKFWWRPAFLMNIIKRLARTLRSHRSHDQVNVIILSPMILGGGKVGKAGEVLRVDHPNGQRFGALAGRSCSQLQGAGRPPGGRGGPLALGRGQVTKLSGIDQVQGSKRVSISKSRKFYA